ncbi:MAG: hypothetical protein H6825_12395 [Planctomycetes bacterium]|nr:hypothetical protein [Planctomycetota bacterium]
MGSLRKLVTKLYARFPSLTRWWLRRHPIETTRSVPFAPFTLPLARARLGLVTSGGVYVEGQLPFDTADPDGDPGWRPLPVDVPEERLAIAHETYDTTAALLDRNVVYPVARARELVAAGRLGALCDEHVGLMGHIDGRHLAALVERTAPAVAQHFVRQRADLVLLVPA